MSCLSKSLSPDVAPLLGPDWAASYEQTLGEMQIGVWVADGRKGQTLFPSCRHSCRGLTRLPGGVATASSAWTDRMALGLSSGRPIGIAGQDAKEFTETARKAVKDLPGASSISDDDVAGGLSSPVLVLVADSKATLSTVEAELGLAP